MTALIKSQGPRIETIIPVSLGFVEISQEFLLTVRIIKDILVMCWNISVTSPMRYVAQPLLAETGELLGSLMVVLKRPSAMADIRHISRFSCNQVEAIPSSIDSLLANINMQYIDVWILPHLARIYRYLQPRE